MKFKFLMACLLVSSLTGGTDAFDFEVDEFKKPRVEIDLILNNERKEVLPGLSLMARQSEDSELLVIQYKENTTLILSTREGKSVYVETHPGNELFYSYKRLEETGLYYLCVTKMLTDPDSFQIYITKEGTNTYHVFSDSSKLSDKKKSEPAGTGQPR